jgi:hypothetical protein
LGQRIGKEIHFTHSERWWWIHDGMAMLLFVWYEDTFSNSGKKDRFIYLDIIKEYLAPYIDEVMPITYEFQQGNDPKHAAKVMRWPRSLPI